MLHGYVVSLVGSIDAALVALVAADTGSGGLAGMLNAAAPVWSGKAADGAALNYLVLGDSEEYDAPGVVTFDGYGLANTLTVHVWTADTSKANAFAILARLKALVHRQPLALATIGRTVRGSFSIVSVLPDPSGDVAHGIGRYEVETVQAT